MLPCEIDSDICFETYLLGSKFCFYYNRFFAFVKRICIIIFKKNKNNCKFSTINKSGYIGFVNNGNVSVKRLHS